MTPQQRALDLIECMTDEELAAARALVLRAVSRRAEREDQELVLAHWMLYFVQTSDEHLARS